MPKARDKVQIPQLPPLVKWMIENSTGEQLTYAAQISRGEKFRLLIALFEKFKDYSVYEVFRIQVESDRVLALVRAAARGRTSAFDAFLMFCEVAQKEIIRRRKEKSATK